MGMAYPAMRNGVTRLVNIEILLSIGNLAWLRC